MEKRYRVLRFIAGLYQVLGVLVPILAIAGYLLLGRTTTNVVVNGVSIGGVSPEGLLAVLLPALISGIFLFGFGQLIMVLIHIEENTRRTSLLLGRRVNRT